MKKSAELIELIETLEEEGVPNTVLTDEDSKAVIHLGRQELVLTRKECKLLFSSEETAQAFAESMGPLHSANLELCSLELPEDVKSVLEEHFSTVDEL